MVPTSLNLVIVAEALRNRRSELSSRLEAVRADQRRAGEPLSSDSEDRASQRENDDVVDAIGATARTELARIEAALERIAKGTYGVCVECGRPISSGRLQAIPYVERCSICAAKVE